MSPDPAVQDAKKYYTELQLLHFQLNQSKRREAELLQLLKNDGEEKKQQWPNEQEENGKKCLPRHWGITNNDSSSLQLVTTQPADESEALIPAGTTTTELQVSSSVSLPRDIKRGLPYIIGGKPTMGSLPPPSGSSNSNSNLLESQKTGVLIEGPETVYDDSIRNNAVVQLTSSSSSSDANFNPGPEDILGFPLLPGQEYYCPKQQQDDDKDIWDHVTGWFKRLAYKNNKDDEGHQQPSHLVVFLTFCWIVTTVVLLKIWLVDLRNANMHECKRIRHPPALDRIEVVWSCITNLNTQNGLNNDDTSHPILSALFEEEENESLFLSALFGESNNELSRNLLLQQETEEDSPHRRAMAWFMVGPGRRLKPHKEKCSAWNSHFATVYALLIVRATLNVTNPSWNTHVPLKDLTDICHWKYITCDAQSNIQGLQLNHANLTGSIPMELMRLESLQYLDLDNNPHVHGNIPTQIGYLTQLRKLFLQQTNVDGKIPTELGLLTNLQQLLLDDTNLSGVMPNQVCELRRNGSLDELRADCGGGAPTVRCDRPSCCTSCHG